MRVVSGGKRRWDASPLGGCHGVEELVLRFCIDLESVLWFECWSWKEERSWSTHRGSLVVLDLGHIVASENISGDQLVPALRSFFTDVKCPSYFTITTFLSHA